MSDAPKKRPRKPPTLVRLRWLIANIEAGIEPDDALPRYDDTPRVLRP